MTNTFSCQEKTIKNGVSVLSLGGRLGLGDVKHLSEALKEAERHAPKSIELDLAQLAYIDSAGIGLLAHKYKYLLDRGIEFYVSRTPASILKVLRLTNLDTLLLREASTAAVVGQAGPQALWESYQFIRTLLKGLGDGLLGTDMEGQILFANEAAEDLLGFSESDLQQKNIQDLLDQPNQLVQWDLKRMSHEPHRQLTLNLKQCDGAILEAVLSMICIRRNTDSLGFFIGISDRSELERTRHALKVTQQQLSLMAGNTPDALLLYDAEERLNFVNVSAEELTGYHSMQLITMRPADLAAHDWEAQWQELWREVREGDTVPDRELMILTASGQQRWCSVSAVPVALEQTDREGILLTLRDIHDRRVMQDRYGNLEKMESLSRLAGGLSRDFYRIMERTQAQMQKLGESLGAEHPGRHILAELQQEQEYYGSLVRQLMICGNYLRKEPRPTCIETVLNEVLSVLKPRTHHGVTINTELDLQATTAAIDPTDLSHVLMNVLLNALESVGEQGKILITTRPSKTEATSPEKPGTRPAGNFVLLSVMDNGWGMTDEVRSRALEPFFTTKQGGLGAGLGLPLVYGLLRQVGGWLELQTTLNEGTQVEIYLPVAQAEEGPLKPESAAGPVRRAPAIAGHQGGRILVVDDEPLVLDFAVAFLRHAGHIVVQASNGAEAREYMAHHKGEIDLILMDLSLPDITGMELIEIIYKLDSSVKIVLSSGLGDAAIAEARKLPGVCGALSKPYRGEQLAQAVRESIGD